MTFRTALWPISLGEGALELEVSTGSAKVRRCRMWMDGWQWYDYCSPVQLDGRLVRDGDGMEGERRVPHPDDGGSLYFMDAKDVRRTSKLRVHPTTH